jgi:hypothetical protein
MPFGPARPRRAEIDLRRSEALKLRIQGYTYQAIADAMGYADRKVAHNDVKLALASVAKETHENAEEMRSLELERLEALWNRTWKLLDRENVTVSHGKVIYIEDPETGEKVAVRDDAPTLATVDRLVRISERKAKLAGLDKPNQLEVSGTIKYEVVGVPTEFLGEADHTPERNDDVLELEAVEEDEPTDA